MQLAPGLVPVQILPARNSPRGWPNSTRTRPAVSDRYPDHARLRRSKCRLALRPAGLRLAAAFRPGGVVAR